MSANIKFKEEIISALNQLEEEKKGSANSSTVLLKLKDLILQELAIFAKSSEFELSNFKALWGRRVRLATESLDLANCKKRASEKTWRLILDQLPQSVAESSTSSSSDIIATPSETNSSAKSSTSSLGYQQRLNTEDLLLFKSNYERITNKWVLSSGTCVEDVMYEISRNFAYEHPAHSFIFSPDDDVWKDHFSFEDLKEIKEGNEVKKLSKEIPKQLWDVLIKLNKKKTYKEMYDEFKDIKADRHDDPDLYWIKESVLNYIELFYDSNTVQIHSEQDLLDEVYGFIKKSRRISRTRTEKVTGSKASSEVKNRGRSLGSTSMINRQIPGDHADLAFFHKSIEAGCVEIGLFDKGSNGTKELQEKSLKTPRMMKAFAMQIVDSFPAIDLANVETVGFIISGMWIVALKMRFDHGSVSLMSTSKRLKMPESIKEVPSLLPPVLTLIYSHAQTIRKTAEYIDDIATSVTFGSSSEPIFIPPCFAPSTKAYKKRKS